MLYGQSPHHQRLWERKDVKVERREVCLDVNTVSVLCVTEWMVYLWMFESEWSSQCGVHPWLQMRLCDFVPLTKGSLALGTRCCLEVQYLYSRGFSTACFFFWWSRVSTVWFCCFSLTVLSPSQQQSVFVTMNVSHSGTVLVLVHIPPPVIPKTHSTPIFFIKIEANLQCNLKYSTRVNSLSF